MLSHSAHIRRDMEQITLRIQEDVLEDVEAEAEGSNQSRAEYLREVIESRNESEKLRDEYEEKAEQLRTEFESEVDELEAKVNELQTELDRVHREKRQVLDQREENQELKRYVEDELSWREQSLGTRLKWWVFGKGSD